MVRVGSNPYRVRNVRGVTVMADKKIYVAVIGKNGKKQPVKREIDYKLVVLPGFQELYRQNSDNHNANRWGLMGVFYDLSEAIGGIENDVQRKTAGTLVEFKWYQGSC